jgi:hypothetical protein
VGDADRVRSCTLFQCKLKPYLFFPPERN